MKIEAIVAGTTYDLSNDTEFMLMEQSDLGMAAVKRLTEQGPLQHGVSDVGFRLQARKFALKVGLNANSWIESESRRLKLLQIFRPRDEAIAIRKTLNNGAKRQIDCFYSGGLQFNSKDRKGVTHIEAIEMTAPDPTFYDPTMVSVSFGLMSGEVIISNAFDVPLAIPWSIGSSVIGQGSDIHYTGTWRTFPIVKVTGPIDDAVILNETTGAKLDFTGASIAAGENLTIDTRYGYKTIIDQDGVNQIALLTDDSDLAEFCIEAEPDAPGGVNSLRVTGQNVTEATLVLVQFYTRFVGI